MKRYLTALFILLSYCRQHSEEKKMDLKLYAFSYGTSLYSGKLMNTESRDKNFKIHWLFYLLVDDDRRILVDTGFSDADYVTAFGLRDFRIPKDVLEAGKFRSEDITDIVITHSHFDHIGGADSFKNAKIHITEREFQEFKRSGLYGRRKAFYDSKEKNNEIIYTDNGQKLGSSMELIHSNGHTTGSQALKIRTDKKSYIITGDECYLPKECEEGSGLNPEASFSLKNNRHFIQNHVLKDKNQTVLTMHDPEIEKKGKKDSQGFVRIF